MLKKQERLTKQAFDRSFSLGKRLHTKELQLIYHPSPAFQAAVVVGKKVYKKAVDRNRLRRQLYATLSDVRAERGFVGTVIVVAKPALAAVPQKKRATLLRQALVDIGW